MKHCWSVAIFALCVSCALGFCIQNEACRVNEVQLTARSLDTEWSGDDLSRRTFFLSAASVAAATQLASFTTSRSSNIAMPLSVPDAIQWIDDKCDRRFLHAVVASDYQFLYRGVPSNKISIRNEKPDLLLPGTYDDSSDALDFFQQLESVMEKDVVKPSNGHLATTSSRDAAQWGTPASIWPVSSAHYAWFQDGGLFYPNSRNLDRNSIIVDGRDCGKDSLEDALRGDSWEVMVATDSFLAVPASMDQALREGLQSSFLV